MPATPQSQAIAVSNQLISTAQAIYNLSVTATQNVGLFNQNAMAGTLNALATCATNADGSLGIVDASPVNGHVINTALPANSGLNRAISAADLATIVTFLTAFNSLVAGTAVAQQGEAPQLLAKLING